MLGEAGLLELVFFEDFGKLVVDLFDGWDLLHLFVPLAELGQVVRDLAVVHNVELVQFAKDQEVDVGQFPGQVFRSILLHEVVQRLQVLVDLLEVDRQFGQAVLAAYCVVLLRVEHLECHPANNLA